jgi:hypothetical protein
MMMSCPIFGTLFFQNGNEFPQKARQLAAFGFIKTREHRLIQSLMYVWHPGLGSRSDIGRSYNESTPVIVVT